MSERPRRTPTPYCPNCGTAVAEEARVCPNCSYPLRSTAPPPPAQPSPKQEVPGSPLTQAQPGAQYYGTQPPAAAPGNDGQATAALVLGILGIFLCPLVLSIPALIIGRQSIRRIEASGGTIGGLGVAKAGFILGIIGTALGAIPLLFLIFLLFAGFMGAGVSGF